MHTTKMKQILLFALLLTGIAGCKNSSKPKTISDDAFTSAYAYRGVDTIDVYQLQLNGTHVFGYVNELLDGLGLPEMVRIYADTVAFTNRAQLDSIVAEVAVSTSDLMVFQYHGFQVGFYPPNRTTMEYIDFRETDYNLAYGKITFNGSYSIAQFRKDFPLSSKTELGELMLFAMVTGESGEEYKSYMLLRRSIDDPYADPTLELTFKDGKLVYIFFANF